MTSKDALQQFLEYLEIEKNRSPRTVTNYKFYLERFFNFAKLKNAEDITLDSVRRYRLELHRKKDRWDKELKTSTQNYHLIALRSFLKYLSKKNIPAIAPESLDIPKGESRSLKFLDRDQIERLLGSAEDPRDKAILEVLFSTGLRVSELVKLNRDQINFERKEFGVIGKGRRPRVVFLSDSAIY